MVSTEELWLNIYFGDKTIWQIWWMFYLYKDAKKSFSITRLVWDNETVYEKNDMT